MTGITIYMEGGGDNRDSRAALRGGMNVFLKPLRQLARNRKLRWKVVACGSRNAAYGAYRNAVSSDFDTLAVLLVDSEDGVTTEPRAHLTRRDGWDLAKADSDALHLMAQSMETWIVADPEAVTEYYGQGFRTDLLPARRDLEKVPKAQVADALKKATRRTSKERYHKIQHASDLLRLIDRELVRGRCSHCERMFSQLEERLSGG